MATGFRLAIVMGIALLSITGGSFAGTRPLTYVATDERTAVFAGDMRVVVGGSLIETPTKPLRIKVKNLNGPGVQVNVCQWLEHSGVGEVCDTRGEAVSFCSTLGGKSLVAENVMPGRSIVVEVRTASRRCPTIATGGTITIDS